MPSRALHTQSGESCYAMDQPRDTSKHIFTCPICKTPMELVTPIHTCFYFRHESGHEHGSEPESQEHLAMKEWIVKSAREIGLDAVTEVIIQTEDQVNEADVLIPDLKLVVECQCSPLAVDKAIERTENYEENGFDVYWIFGGHLLRTNKDQGKIKQIEEGLQQHVGGPLRYYDGEWYWSGLCHTHIGKEKKGSFFLKRHIFSTELTCLKEKRVPPSVKINFCEITGNREKNFTS